jgi:hypothetical protein
MELIQEEERRGKGEEGKEQDLESGVSGLEVECTCAPVHWCT